MELGRTAVNAADTDIQLIERLAQGDGRALDDLMDRFQEDLIELALHLTGDFGVAEQIVQDAFLVVTRSGCGKMRVPNHPSPYRRDAMPATLSRLYKTYAPSLRRC